LALSAAAFASAGLALALRLVAPAALDWPLSVEINGYAHRVFAFDLAVRTLDRFNLFQGVLMLALGAAAYVRASEDRIRFQLVFGAAGSGAAALASRGLQLFLPHLPRPVFERHISWRAPFAVDLSTRPDWSSFPSDHAALLFGAACAILLTNRRLGLAALLVAVANGLARIYEGEHFPTDVLGGCALGAGMVLASAAMSRVAYPQLKPVIARRPALCAAVLVIGLVQAALMFEDLRTLAAGLLKQAL
jgi:undecaprenyl-diphosphatase